MHCPTAERDEGAAEGGPRMRIAFCDSPSRAFASCSRSELTVAGISPVEAGITKPSPSP